MSTPDVASFNRVGRRYLEQGDLDSAALCFRKALAIAPADAEALAGLKETEASAGVAAPPAPVAPPVAPAPGAWCSAVRSLPALAGELQQRFQEAHVLQELRDPQPARTAYEAAAKFTAQCRDELSRQWLHAAEWALHRHQWVAALGWFDLADAASPGAPARAGRRQAAQQILAARKTDGHELFRVLSQWVSRVETDAEAWEFAAEVLAWFGIPARALTARLRASRLRGEEPDRRAEWERALATRSEKTRGRTNVIFYNLTNSGASAIDPILRQLLGEDFGYDLIGTPGVSPWVGPFLHGSTPFYHWTHSGPELFQDLLARSDCRFICLFRDPRDVLVSHAQDPTHRPAWGSKTPRQVLAELASTNFPEFFAQTRAWLALDPARVFRFSFEEMKRDVPAMVRRILEFLGLPVEEGRLRAVSEVHSFERVAGRDRGTEGAAVRTGYLVRKGVAGEWRHHFDEELADLFVQHCGQFLIDWGYEKDQGWAQALAGEGWGPQPFPLLVESSVNGFDLVRHRDCFHAVKAGAAPVVAPVAPAETWSTEARTTSHGGSTSLREVRAWAQAQTPCASGVLEFNLLSAPFSSGLSWLVNVLLALDLRATHVSPRYPKGPWEAAAADGFDRMTPEAFDFMRARLPIAMERGNRFQLEPGREIFWEHRLDSARHAERPTLIFVRDPRDAIYSLYRRNYEKNIAFLPYLRRPDIFPDHFPEMFGLPPAETWAAWHAMWLGLRHTMPLQFVRFEELRAHPLAGVREILAFVGARRTDAQIEEALARSTFERAKAAMEQGGKMDSPTGRVARSGKVGEWKDTYSAEALRCFHGPANAVMEELGYAPAPGDDAGAPAERSLADLVPAAEIQSAVTRARDAWEAGRTPEAIGELRRGAEIAGRQLLARLWLANEFTAITWTVRVFGEALARTAAGNAARTALRGFNERFIAWLPVQRMLSAEFERLLESPPADDPSAAPAAAWAKRSPERPPELVQENYRGFNLVRFRQRIHAVARTLGPVDLGALTSGEWDEHHRHGTILSADGCADVQQAVDGRPSPFAAWPADPGVPRATLPPPAFPATFRMASSS